MTLDEYQDIALSTLGDGQAFGDLTPQLVDQAFSEKLLSRKARGVIAGSGDNR
ncbi:MAG TPA: hypothetical protein VFQ70_03050 [Candidatus Saccharimonadaceae bacterium]|nr:hypothetical protein [Candidatus Saccharimonadaceae bacterium]